MMQAARRRMSEARARGLARLAAALLCAAIALRPGAAASADLLEPFEASYAWLWHGAAVAVSRVKLEHRAGDIWVYSSSSEPRGLGMLYPLRPVMRSVLRVSPEGVRPLSYQATDGTSANERGADLKFDWDAMRVTGVYESVPVDLPLERGVQDDLSIQIALLLALRQGRAPGDLLLIDKNTVRRYSYSRENDETITTRLGPTQTIVFASQHEDSPRVTRFWCAPSKGFVPVRVQQKRVDSVEWTMEIENLDTP
ncbi:MAG: DUF3108 domain-containing protein [Steroidobacteraceae bacterium]|jgi:hypothetical protein